MAEKSIYLQVLEQLQSSLKSFDMSFSSSGKLFRLAIVSELFEVNALFEEFLAAWSVHLPIGSGPDLDIDFNYWKNITSWADFKMAASQNVCIDNLPIDFGNGHSSDENTSKKKKGYKKLLSSVLKSSHYQYSEQVNTLFTTIWEDKTSISTYGNIVFFALNNLCLTLSKIDTLLANPTNELLLSYYKEQRTRFQKSYSEIIKEVENIHREPISERRKENRFRALIDRLRDELIESLFLKDTMEAVTKYDVDDYIKEHPELSQETQLVKFNIIMGDLRSDSEAGRLKVARYIYDRRKKYSPETLSSFFVYLEMLPYIEKQMSFVVSQTPVESNKVIMTKQEQNFIPNGFQGLYKPQITINQLNMSNGTQTNVIPQPGSTINVGCDQRESKFTTYLPQGAAKQLQTDNESKQIN